MKRLPAAPVFVVCALVLAASEPAYVSASRKFQMIESDRLRPGSRVQLTAMELNAWVKQEIAESFPQGVRQPRLVLANGSAIGSALIDFGKVRRAQGHPPGRLMSMILDGERPVEVTARIRSAGGRATVEVESVRVSNVTVDGRTLDFLIHYVLLPNYPDAKVGEPFDLAHRIDRLEVRPTAVDVVIR